jgi:glycine/D-amino acid oxidase-like deaminating enzyme
VTASSVQVRGDRIAALQTNHGALLDLPQSQIKGHIIATEPTDVRLPGTVDPFGSQIEDGRLLCGGTFDEGDDSLEIRAGPVAELWSELSGGLPRLHGTRISHQWACFRPAHPDRLPVIDRVPGLSNAWLTSGHFRTGILMAAATGTCLVDWIRTGQRPDLVAAFGVDRLLALKAQP